METSTVCAAKRPSTVCCAAFSAKRTLRGCSKVEKLHAYTLPRQGRPNTRVKDLVDLVLLSASGTLDARRVRESIAATFRRRATHPVPATLPPPPEAWREPFAELASECGMAPEIEAHFTQVAGFLARVLS